MLRRLCAAAFWLASCHALDLAGSYRQTYSNLYVQYTTEIDWKCVTVHATVGDAAHRLEIYKKARLHGGPVTITTPVQQASMGPSNFTVAHPKRTYDVHAFVNDTVVVTGVETPSLYVWQRSNSSEEPVDIPRLAAFLDSIHFDVPDTTYRKITATYDVHTCA